MPKRRPLRYLLIFSFLVLLLFLIMQPLTILVFHDQIAMLFPAGLIGLEERNLLFVIQILMLLVVIPVFLLTFIFSWKYSAHNPKGKYEPDLVDSAVAEGIWWGLPLLLVLIIGGITWVKTYELDPFKPIESNQKPVTIQVVALQWKWLFIYPEERVASVNFVQFPKDVPVHFEITADAPMNSFWIPHLGGQIYAMPKMKTHLYLIADKAGDYRGSSANLSGTGFSGMHFVARASSDEEYERWLMTTKQAPQVLNWENYEQLARPSQNHPQELYRLQDERLFHQVLMKYMRP